MQEGTHAFWSHACDTAPPAAAAAINAMIHKALHAWQSQVEKYCLTRNGYCLLPTFHLHWPCKCLCCSWGIVRQYDDGQ